jgi:hypothetical protein
VVLLPRAAAVFADHTFALLFARRTWFQEMAARGRISALARAPRCTQLEPGSNHCRSDAAVRRGSTGVNIFSGIENVPHAQSICSVGNQLH